MIKQRIDKKFEEEELFYCPKCKKYVNPIEEMEWDEGAGVYYETLCSECLSRIPTCSDCRYFAATNDDIPLRVVTGVCELRGVHVRAVNFACNRFKWWFEEG